MKLLMNRYDNPGLSIQRHTRAILNSSYIETVLAGRLQGLHNHVYTHIVA